MKKRFNKFLTLLAVLLFGFGQMWGDTFSADEIAAKSGSVNVGTTKNHVTISLPGITATSNVKYAKISGTQLKRDMVEVSGKATGGSITTDKVLSIKVDRGYKLLSPIKINGSSSSTSDIKMAYVGWQGQPEVSFQLCNGATDWKFDKNSVTSEPTDREIAFATTIRTIYLYTQIKTANTDYNSFGTSKTVGSGTKAYVYTVDASATLAPEIEGESQMWNDETIALTGYPTGGTWAVVSGPGAIAADGKLTANGNGTIRVSYTVDAVSETKDIIAGTTKQYTWLFNTKDVMPTTLDVTPVKNDAATFESAGQIKLGTNGDYLYIDLSSKNLIVTAASINAKIGSENKHISFGSSKSATEDGNVSATNVYADVNITPTKPSMVFTVIKNAETSAYVASITLTVKKAVPHTLSYAISPDHDPAYATVTLGATSLIEGATTTATYSAIDAAYEFDEWQISGTGATLSGASGDHVTVTMGSTDATVTLKLKAAVTKYTITYSKGAYGTGDAIPDGKKDDGVDFTLSSSTYSRAGYVQTGWATEDGGAKAYDLGGTYSTDADEELFPFWTPVYTVTKGTHENGDFTISLASLVAGGTVTLDPTPNDGYMFSAWEIVKTSDASATGITVTNKQFEMPAYDVTVNATFVADTRKKVLYLTTASTENDKLYAALKDDYKLTVAAPGSQTLTDYDLIVLHESISGSVAGSDGPVKDAATTSVPVLNTKTYFYNSGRWNWGTPNNGQAAQKVATLNSEYCNIEDHPIFSGVTISAGEVTVLTNDATGNSMQPVAPSSGKEGYLLATTPNASSGVGYAIQEIPAGGFRGASSGKYILISVSNAGLNNLTADGQKLFQNAAAYLIGSTAWAPEAPKTVTHTLTGVTTSSATEVCAGVDYAATYAAASGYSLPTSIVVKVNDVALDAVVYTWNPSTGALSIPAAFVGGNIEIVVNGVFNCPAAGSGDVLFSWTPKSGSASAEYITVGGVDLAPYMEGVVGGAITGYAQDIDGTQTTLYKNSNNHIYFNGNDAYIQVDLCELAEGDKFLVTGQTDNMWVSTSTTRPANAEAAAAVLEPDKAFYIPNASALIGLSTIYIFREAGFTEVASLTITRPEKFTVTYEADGLTDGDVPAAVDAFDGQKIIVAGQGTMVKGADNFAGWKDAGDNAYAAGDELTVTSNLTLTAQWVSCTPLTLAMSGYTTTLTAGGATTTVTLDKGASTGTVTWESSDPTILTVADGVVTPLKGGVATVTAHVAEDGTYCANDITSDEITVNCVVAYDANGGEGTMADGVGTTVTIAANGFTYDSHKFLRWNTQPDGLGDDVAVGATVNENKTLYAIWKTISCQAGTNIFSIEFTNAAAVTMSDGDEELNLASYATIVGGNAYMKYYKSGTSDATVINSSHKANYTTNDQYLRLELDCALQAGDVITVADGSGKQIAIAIGVVPPAQPTNSTKEVTVGYVYTVQAGDNLVGQDNLFLGRAGSGGTTHGIVTIYRPLPDASVPTIDAATPADASYAATDPIAAMTVSADAVAPKDLHYQWYKENGETDIEVGTDAASYTPTASGEYYCVVTNSPSGYTAKSATSRTATITLVSSDATLAWIKAGDVNIALSAGVYDYEYTLPYDYAAATAPTVTVGTTDPNANADAITQAASKNGTATIHVVAQDNVTYKDYSVKFNEYSGCMDAFWFAEEADATANSLTNNTTFFSNMVGDGTGVSATFDVDGTEYTVTRGTSSSSTFGKLTIPAGFNANVYVALKTSGNNRTVTLVPTSGPSYTSANLATAGNHVAEFEDVAAGTYNINVSSGSNFVMVKAHMCKFAVTDVSLPATESVLVGKTVTLTPVFTPTYASNKNVTWASDAEGVATVTNGVVTGVAPGTANITVTTVDGGFETTCAVTVSAMDCNTFIGNLFSFAVVATENKQYTEVGEGSNEKVIGAEVATIESGAAYVGHTSSSATIDVANKQSGVWYFKFGDSNTYLRIELSCALQTGDIISLTSLSQDFYISTTATYPSDAANRIEIPANGAYVVLHGDILDGADEIYVWRKSGSTYLKTLSIDRNTPDYKRTVNPAYLGTLCWTNNAILGGATLFEFKGKNENNYLVFDEVDENRLEAGKPYVFLPDNGKTEIKVYNTDSDPALTEDQAPVNNMYGTLTGKTLVPGVDDNMYYFSASHIWAVKDFTVNINVPAYYCYVDYDAVLAGAPASAPAAGRRRVTMGVNGKDAAQGFENILGGETPMKVMIDGTLYIIRGEKVFDATGRLVK